MQKMLSALLFIFIFSSLQAQVIDLGINFGASFYSGDLASSDLRQMVQESRPAVGVFCRLANSRKFSTRFNLNYLGLMGDDARSPYPERMLNFRTNVWEFNVVGESHMIRIRHTEHSASFPYLFGGVGLYHFNPKAEVDGDLVELQPLGTEGQGLPGYGEPYKRLQFNIPFGAGIKFVNRRFTFGFEAGARYLFTDYLDDVSNVTVNHRELFEGNGPLAARLSNPQLGGDEGIARDYRRGSAYKDWYYMMNITLSYNFGEAIHKLFADPVPCPRFW